MTVVIPVPLSMLCHLLFFGFRPADLLCELASPDFLVDRKRHILCKPLYHGDHLSPLHTRGRGDNQSSAWHEKRNHTAVACLRVDSDQKSRGFQGFRSYFVHTQAVEQRPCADTHLVDYSLLLPHHLAIYGKHDSSLGNC